MKKKKKGRSASKPTSPMSLIRGSVGQRNVVPLRTALSSFKMYGPIEKFSLAYILAASSTQFSQVFPAGRKIEKFGSIGIATPCATASLAREVQWAATACYFSREIIGKFVRLRLEFFRSLIAGDFDTSRYTLDEINRECGCSSWEIENRIFLLSVSEGFEVQKRYVQEITRETKRSHVSFLAANFGQRNEPRVTASAYSQRITSRSKTWGVDALRKSYLLYKLTNTLDATEGCYATVLAHEGACAAIDLYESFLDIIRRSKFESFHDSKSCVAALDFLAEIDDKRIANLRELVGEDIATIRVTQSAESLHRKHSRLFAEGHYEPASRVAFSVIQQDPHDLPAIFTYAKCLSMGYSVPGDLSWYVTTVSNSLAGVYRGDLSVGESVDTLLRLANNLHHSDFGEALIAPIVKRTSAGFEKRNEINRSSRLYLRNVDSPQSSTRDGSSGPPTGNLCEDYNNYSSMRRNISLGEFDQAFVHAVSLESSKTEYYRTQGTYYSAHILAKSLQLEASLEKSVSIYVKNPQLLVFTPLHEIIRTRGFRDLKAMVGSPSLAIGFFVYMETTGQGDKEVALKVAWKRYLASKNVSKPSLLDFSLRDTVTKEEIYFLSKVCLQETMELGGAFSSQLDLDKERMSICSALTQLDVENREMYDHEIVDLTRRINIEEGVEYLESSRVFVDEIGVQKWAAKNLDSQFLRYIDHLNAGLFSTVRELEAEIIKIAATAKNRRAALASYLDDYDVSAETLLEEVLREAAQAFLLLPRFGLDAFLSSRVRHGSFVGYLRGPLESRRLVTKKSSLTGKYQDNDYILDSWGLVSTKDRHHAKGKLAQFSSRVDYILDEAVSKYLHVASKSRPDGKINFGTELGTATQGVKRWLLILKAMLDEQSTLNELVSYSFMHFFWPSVKYSLDNLQTYVKNDLGNSLLTALDETVDSILPTLEESRRAALLRDRFYGREEIRASVDRVALWFDSPKNNARVLTMTLERAIEIGLRSTKNARPNFEPQVNWTIQPNANIEISGPAIGHINDIAFSIFENISKHSGFEETELPSENGPAVDVAISANAEFVEIFVTSQISLRKDTLEVMKGIGFAKDKIIKKEFENVTQTSHGTGLVRLAMNSGMREDDDTAGVDFGLDQKNRFYVKVSVARGIVEAISEAELSS